MFFTLLLLGIFNIMFNRARGQGNPCTVNYKTIREKVPYCGASSWLHWDCLNTCTDLSTQMNNITRLRALCCTTSNCIAECNFPKDYDKDIQYCGNVCPPFFTSSPQSTPSTASLSTTTSTKPTSSSTTTTQPTAAPAGNQQGNGVGNGITTAPTTPSTSAGTVGHIATAPNGHNNGQTIASALLTTTFTPNSPQTTTKSSVLTIRQAQTQHGISSIVTTQTHTTVSTSKFQNVVVNVDTTQILSTATAQQAQTISGVQTGPILFHSDGRVTPTVPSTLAPAGQTNSISGQNSDGVADKTCPLGPWKLHDNYNLPGM